MHRQNGSTEHCIIIDIMLNTEPLTPCSDWVLHHCRNLDLAYRQARRRMQDEAMKRKTRFDQHVTLDPVSRGQTVLLQNQPKGRNKIQDKWKEEMFEVTEVRNNVYTVISKETGELKRVHRNEIKCVSFGSGPEAVDSADTEQNSNMSETGMSTDSDS